MKKKVLFLFDMYYPRMSPNGICVDAVMKEFVKQGYQVSCIVNAHPKAKKQEKKDDITIFRVRPRWIYRMQEWCYERKTPYAKVLLKVANFFGKIKLFMMAPWWPLVSPSYTARIYRQAKKLHQREKFDTIVGIYVPIDNLIVASRLKKMDPKIQYVAYFLDSLSGGFGPSVFSNEYIIRNGQKWQERVLWNVDQVIAMKSSQKHHEQYNRQASYFSKITFLDIPLLVQPEKHLKKGTLLVENKINVVYVGSLNTPLRNISFFLSLLSNLNNMDIVYTFIGETNSREQFEEMMRKFPGQIHYYDPIDHDKVHRVLANADILLNLGTPNESQIPCKITEYMAYGKPIIHTYSVDGEPSLPYLRKYGNCLLIDERRSDIKKIMEELETFVIEKQNHVLPFEQVEKLFSANTPQAFVKQIENKK